jgi:hypothetical protein
MRSRHLLFQASAAWTTVRPLGKFRQCTRCGVLARGTERIIEHGEMHEKVDSFEASEEEKGEPGGHVRE